MAKKSKENMERDSRVLGILIGEIKTIPISPEFRMDLAYWTTHHDNSWWYEEFRVLLKREANRLRRMVKK